MVGTMGKNNKLYSYSLEDMMKEYGIFRNISITSFYSLLEERNFHNVSEFLKDVNSKVSKQPKVIHEETNKFVINYSDNNEIVVYFSFYDNKFQECSFSYHFPLNNKIGYSTTCGYFIKPNDKSFTSLPNYMKWANDINHHIKNAEISAQIRPIKYKAEIVLQDTHELKTIALFDDDKESSIKRIRELYPNAIITSLVEC